ncbi:uncharacterized protein LOC111617653, partial [Centruroides sculpturatus]|uniref:uncharacterized protein LOC111617653 n=1 Tax=Centruroides sculpturatus TaxID=218467 RepID=UPI000C6DD457
MDEFRSIRAIIQPYPSLPLTILGQPVTLRIYILITSTFPLRAYLHTQGIVYRRHLVGNRTLRKIPSQVWNMNQFWNHLRIKNGDHSVRLAIRRLFGVLVQILLSLETLLSTEDNAQRRRDFYFKNNAMRLRPWFRVRCIRDWLCLALLLTSLSLYFNHRVFNPQYHSTFSGFDSSTTLKRSILNQIGNESGSTSCIRSRIHRLLTEIEEKTLRLWKETNSKIALVRGQSSIIARDFSTYQAVLENLGFIVKTWSSGNNSDNLRPHLLICFTFSDPLNCWQKSNRQGVKLNKLPSLRSNIWQREAICSLLRNSNVSCYVLPSDYDVFISSATSSNLNWLVQLQSGENWKVLEASDIIKQMDEFRSIRAIIQPYPSLPLTILGQPVTLRIYILITSTFPLRAYLHTQGIVYRRHLVGNRTLRKIPSQVWNMNQFWNHLRIKNGDHSVRLAIRRLFGVLVQILLSLETLLSTEDNAQRRCQQCFQLLGFDILFDISLHPYVVEVNGQPDMRHTDNVMTNNIKRGVVSDTTNLVFAIDSVSDRVTEALMRLDPEAIGILGINCRVNHEFCLSYTDLNLLLDTQREYLNRGGFIQ